MKISENIKNHLKNEKSLSDFAKKVRLPTSTLHGWLNGVAPKNLKDIKRVADYLGITIDELCFGSEINDLKKTNVKVMIDDQEFDLVLKRSSRRKR